MPVRRFALISAAVAAALLALPREARAAESPMPTAQQRAFGMDWVPYIDPADLPPVEKRKVLCLVDSGVAVTPDLPPDRPEGPIVERISIDGGTGLPGPLAAQQHGTEMASFAGAIAGNDWGTVGAWPGIRILSVRAMAHDETMFRVSSWRRGLTECRRPRGYDVAAVNLSLGGAPALPMAERRALEEEVARTRAFGGSVVAAAGNRAGTRLDAPADVPGVLAIAAGSATGGLCPYATHAAAILVGPGCQLDASLEGVPAIVDGGGSSAAAVIVSAITALLRSLVDHNVGTDPGPDAVEGWMLETADRSTGYARLDVTRAARTAGLGAVVDRALLRRERSVGTSYSPVPTPDVLPQPRVRVTWRQGVLRLRLGARPLLAETLRIVTTRSGKRTVRHRRIGSTVVKVPMQHAPRTVTLRFLPHEGDSVGSGPAAVLKRRGRSHYQ